MSAYSDALAETAARTLEDLCFFYVTPLMSDAQRDARVDGTMEVHFRGPLTGRLAVRLCGGTMRTLASNMLGDVEGTMSMQRDALGELANVICGNLLPIIGGRDAIYEIDAAQPVPIFGFRAAGLEAEVHLGLEHDGRADLLLFLERPDGAT